MVPHPFNPSTREVELRQNSDLKARRVYRVRSRRSKAVQRNCLEKPRRGKKGPLTDPKWDTA